MPVDRTANCFEIIGYVAAIIYSRRLIIQNNENYDCAMLLDLAYHHLISISEVTMDRVCHFEVPYSDKQRMEKFYSDVFGWQFMPSPGDMPYTFVITTEMDESFMPKRSGGINGGSYPRGEGGGTSSPVIVLEVESTEQRIKDVVAAGGEAVLGPNLIEGMGVYAQVKDSEGNTIGLWQPLR